MLRLENINARRGGLQVLWDVSFAVGEGEIVALLGGNGAGKTTILDVIAGLIKPKGAIDFLGRSIVGLPPNKIAMRGLAYVPEGGKPFPDMSVRENLEMGAYLQHLWAQRKTVMEDVFNTFPRLRERTGQQAGALSGGERQMLAIGRAMMARPKLCLFDEPSYGLAPILVKELLRLISTLRDRGITVLIVEQNINQTLDIADRAYVLENGRAVMEGRADSLQKDEYIRKAYLGL